MHRNHVEHSFRLICEQLDRSKTEILGAISDIEEQQLSKIEPWIKEHKEMKDAASRSVQELKALRDQKDPVLFLKVPNSPSQRYCSTCVGLCTVLILLS